jgi:hypothetical protein
METFIPSTPSPAGFAASASGLGAQAAPADASASGSGLFLQILLGSCAGQAPACGGSAEAPAGEREGAAAGDEAAPDAGEPAAAENPVPPALSAAAPLPAAQGTPPVFDETASADVSPAGCPADNAAAYPVPVQASIVSAAADPGAAAGPATVAVAARFVVSAEQAAPAAVPRGERAAVAVSEVPADARAEGSISDEPAADTPAGRAAAAVPVPSGKKDIPAFRPERFTAVRDASAAAQEEPAVAKPTVEPALGRPEPPAAAPARGAETDPAAAARDGGNPSAPGKKDPDSFSFIMARESASADEAPEESSRGKASVALEAAEPGASHAIVAGRNAAEAAPAPRPPMQAPVAAPPQRTFHAGENAFVLTRKSDTSVEITLSPPGVGRLEIEVVVDKGVVNANITAADPAGREAIERSLPQIMQALADEGMAIGGFTVSLKQGDGRDGDTQAGNAQAGKGPGDGSSGADAPGIVRSAPGRSGLVDILV